MNSLGEVAKFIQKNDDFIITSHVDPDGDNIASQLALFSVFKILGKNAIILDQDPIPERYSFLLENDEIFFDLPEIPNFSAAFIVDVANLKRVGDRVGYYIKAVKNIINIDHHRSNELFGTYNVVDSQSCAAAVLIYKLAQELQIPWNAELATRIYTGIMTDTGGFRYQNTDEESFAIATEMVRYGANPGAIAYNVYSQRPISVIRLLVEALSSIEQFFDGRVALMKITKEQYARAGALPEHSEGLINYASSIKGTHIAIFLREDDDRIRVSFRSNGQVDVDKIARDFGGGGHKNAAGCRIQGDIEEAELMILDKIKKLWE